MREYLILLPESDLKTTGVASRPTRLCRHFFALLLPGLASQALTASAGTTLTLVYLGLFPTALAYVTYAYAMSRMDASVAVSFLYLIPVLAYLIAWI